MLYGPVSSWRLGKSLGIDLICSEKKICSFNCIYCQLGKQLTKTTLRKKFISIKEMEQELISALDKISPNVLTFSGFGEPTLAKNINLAIKSIKKITDIPIAILTNSTLLNQDDVKKSLTFIDIVIAKLDAYNEKLFKEINQPKKNITFKKTLDGILKFKEVYKGKFCIQTMFMKNNINYCEEIADIISKIKPDEVQINTPLRPCSIKPLNKKQLSKIEDVFKSKDLNAISVFSSSKPSIQPLDKVELIKRRRTLL